MSLPRSSSPSSSQIPLRWVLVVPFVVQIFVAVGITGYLSIRNGQRAVSEVTQQLRSELSSRIEEQLDSYLEIPHWVNALSVKAIRRFNLWNLEDMSSMQGYFADQLIHFPNLSYVGFGGEEREFAGAGRENDGSLIADITDSRSNFVNRVYEADAEGNPLDIIEENPDYDPTIRPWYRAAFEVNQGVWTEIYLTPNKRPVFSAVEPFYDSQNILRGVLVVDLSLWNISEFLQGLKIGITGKAFIMERNGFLVASSYPEESPVNEEGELQRLLASESSNELIRASVASLKNEFGGLEAILETRQLNFTINDRQQLLQVTPITDTHGLDWLIVVAVPESDFMEQINANTRQTIVLCLLALAIAIGIGIYTSPWVTRPIKQISQASDQLAQGDLSQQVNPNPIVEIDRLANSFNGMAHQLQESFHALRQSEATNRAIITSIPDLMIRSRGDGTYLDIMGSDRMQKVKTKSRFSPGDTVYESLPSELAQLRMNHIQAALETGELQVYEQQITIEGHTQDEEVRIFVLGEDEVLVMIRDITARKQNERLQEENMRMSAELNIAQEIQQMILPRAEELSKIDGLDIACYMAPADEVGGDYYDVLEVDGIITIGIGDVTGHGLESGLLMLMTQMAVRTLKEMREENPVRFLDTLNRAIYCNIKRMNTDLNLTLAILNYSRGQISISGQHEETLVVRSDGTLERIDTMDLGLPIGLDDDIADFIDHIFIDLSPRDGVVLYTDGIPEAYNLDKEQYGMKRLCEVISHNWHQTAEGMKEAVIEDVRQFIGEQKVFDDITLLVLKQQ